LNDAEIKDRLKQIDVIQLDSYSDTKVLTPEGKRTTARKWAQNLDIYYSPTIIFFDEHGKEIIRINSVVWVYRLKNVLEYVLSGEYKKYETYQLWRQHLSRVKSGVQ
jgi:thioredoxin-related protein